MLKLALFIDGVSLSVGARTLGFKVDFVKLLQYFRDQGVLVRAFYYTPLADPGEFAPHRTLVDWLSYNGFKVTTKPPKEIAPASDRLCMKNSLQVDLAVDAWEIAPHLDEIFLFSGDANYCCLVQALQRRGLRITAISMNMADDLRRQVDATLDLETLLASVGTRTSAVI